MKNAQKNTLAKSAASAVMLSHSFFLLGGGSLKIACFAENTGKPLWFQKYTKCKQSSVNIWSKVVLKFCSSILRNMSGPVFNTTFGH